MENNYFIKNIIIAFLFLLTCTMVGQSIKGKVVDAKGETLPYINVMEKETTSGTMTDDIGEFSLKVKKIPTTLVISSVGFKTTEKTISSKKYVTIILIEESVGLDEVLLVGTRNKNRTVIETPVPVDVIDIKELTSAGPQVNLNQILNYVVPSFSSNTQTISDGTDHVDPASLRGLGPDQVLVLINGKRRHTSSLVNVNGTFGRGSVGTDLNAIPTAAIKRLEVLRDGAAAQYGSDAIAGVINIVLNDNTNELSLAVTSGTHLSKNSNGQTGGSDGGTVNVSANYGINLGDKGGFINFTGDFDYRAPYNRMKEFKGQIFNSYNAIERLALAQNLDVSKLSDADVVKISQKYLSTSDAAIVKGFSSTQLHTPTTRDKITKKIIFYNPLSKDVTEAELTARGQKRSDYNMRVGQSKVRGGRFFANLSFPFDDKGTEFYSFAGFSSRKGNSAGFYRLPSQARTYTPLYIDGFLPEINSKINDKSVAVGIKGKIGEWDVDFSNTWGKNSFDFQISNTSNASLLIASPTNFDAGGFSFAQNTTNLDFTRYYEDIFKGFNVAFGMEHRLETYDILAGEKASYTKYDANGQPVTPITKGTTDFFGRGRPGGSQVFPGFTPNNELSRERSSFAAYTDVEVDFTENLLVSGALRFENYSDFGSTLNFKIASRYKVTDNFNLRGAVSTGFRAPSLHQSYFNAVATLFVAGIPSEVGTFSNDSDIAKQLGIPKLKQEESTSTSIGFTSKLSELNLQITADAYFVGIKNRVVLTGQFKVPENIVTSAQKAAFFANAIDTESKGIDIVLTNKINLNEKMSLKSDLSATFSQTKRVGDIHSSKILKDSGQENIYFDESSKIYLEKSVPRTKINLSNTLSIGKFNLFLRNVYFGSVTEAINTVTSQQKYNPKLVTDLTVGFKATDALTLTVGANNLFDIYPDRISLPNPNYSSGRFEWSRRAQQFGIGGRFIFARLNFILH